MSDFRDILAECNLHDLAYKGTPWTYNNKQSGRYNVKAMLDRGVASPDWNNIFGNAMVERLVSSRSDHAHLLLRLGARKEWRPVKKYFKYEYMWERASELTDVIINTWSEGGTGNSLTDIY